jgi:hypothetical protein
LRQFLQNLAVNPHEPSIRLPHFFGSGKTDGRVGSRSLRLLRRSGIDAGGFFDFARLGHDAANVRHRRGSVNEPAAFARLAEQRVIVAEIEAEQALVAANRELIARMEKKIQATLARVWGEAPAGA